MYAHDHAVCRDGEVDLHDLTSTFEGGLSTYWGGCRFAPTEPIIRSVTLAGTVVMSKWHASIFLEGLSVSL